MKQISHLVCSILLAILWTTSLFGKHEALTEVKLIAHVGGKFVTNVDLKKLVDQKKEKGASKLSAYPMKGETCEELLKEYLLMLLILSHAKKLRHKNAHEFFINIAINKKLTNFQKNVNDDQLTEHERVKLLESLKNRRFEKEIEKQAVIEYFLQEVVYADIILTPSKVETYYKNLPPSEKIFLELKDGKWIVASGSAEENKSRRPASLEEDYDHIFDLVMTKEKEKVLEDWCQLHLKEIEILDKKYKDLFKKRPR